MFFAERVLQAGICPQSYFSRLKKNLQALELCAFFMENGFPLLASIQKHRTLAGREESFSAEELVD